MAKVDIDLVRAVLQRSGMEIGKIKKVIEDLTFESKSQAAEKEKEPTIKKQYVAVVSDPHGKILSTGYDYQCWIVQIPEDDSPETALERLHQGAYDFNVTPKGRRMPLKTLGEACEFGSAKVYKEHKVWVKTKEPVLCVLTNNKIPRTESKE